MSEPKVYVGNAKEITTQYGTMLKISLGPDDIKKILDEANKNNGWANLDCSQRKEVSDKGFTHSIWINSWKPDANQGQQQGQQASNVPQSSYNPAMDTQNQGLGPKVEHVANSQDNFDTFSDDIPF